MGLPRTCSTVSEGEVIYLNFFCRYIYIPDSADISPTEPPGGRFQPSLRHTVLVGFIKSQEHVSYLAIMTNVCMYMPFVDVSIYDYSLLVLHVKDALPLNLDY